MEILDVLTGMARTGRLGPVSGGAAWSDVTAALGEPRDMGTTGADGEWPGLFAYGDLELSVCDCREVSLVCVQTWRDVVELPRSVTGGTGTFPAGLGYADVVSALDSAGCSWAPYAPLTFGDQCSLVVSPSGANFTFEIPEGGEPLLNIVSLPGYAHDCPGPPPGRGAGLRPSAVPSAGRGGRRG
ncbi:hypothetical protein [Streptomyces sp. bgisy095]|uniref:hypothetical protein n=1 Tax=unclassified Streptomyces TaxID=2593676 RepID=UPI003D751DAC